MTHTKQCSCCGVYMLLNLFQKDSSRKDGLRPECKVCTAKNRKKNYSKARTRKHNLEKKFGNGALDVYNELFTKQEGVCAICSSKENGRYSHLSIDHCHTGGHIRGLLCNNCNRALGLFKDNAELMRKAADYVEKY